MEERTISKTIMALRQSLGQDYFITGANAVTEDDRIISVDRAGNRVAGMIFGARKVILAIGQNKIVRDLEAAFQRIEKVISPVHAKNRGFNTPCVQKGECVNLASSLPHQGLYYLKAETC